MATKYVVTLDSKRWTKEENETCERDGQGERQREMEQGVGGQTFPAVIGEIGRKGRWGRCNVVHVCTW